MARGHHFRPTEAHMGDKAMRAKGGRIPGEETGKVQNHNPELNVDKEAEGEERKKGGRVKHVTMDGAKDKHRRLDRPGRKRGGGVGADMTPLTTAARTRQGTAHKADGDDEVGG